MPGWVPPEIARLPKVHRDIIRKQCGEDWTRVVADADGGFTVHNRARDDSIVADLIDDIDLEFGDHDDARVMTEVLDEEPARPVHPAVLLRQRKPVPPARPPRWVAPPQPRATPDPGTFRRMVLPVAKPKDFRYERPLPPSVIAEREAWGPGARVVTPRPAPPPAPLPAPPPAPAEGRTWTIIPGIETAEDWTGEDPADAARKVQAATREGLPPKAPLLFHEDVTTLFGVTKEIIESVCRDPRRVGIDPLTVAKKHPVLRYWLGDLMVVVDFGEPSQPMVIAAYDDGQLIHNRCRKALSATDGIRGP